MSKHRLGLTAGIGYGVGMRAGLWTIATLGLFTLVACEDPEDTDAGTADTGAPDVGFPDSGADGGVPLDAQIDSGVDGGVVTDAEPSDAIPTDSGPPDIRIPGLSAPVTVRFDDRGVTHLSCATDDDCFAAEGYYHAAHRFGQMDTRRRFASGRLAEIFGAPAVADIDQNTRTFIATRDGGDLAQRMWDTADARTKAAITAYTRGVNAFLADMRADRNGARLTLEWAHLEPFVTDWTELDSVYCVLALAQDLTDQSGFELRLGEGYATLPATVALDLFGLRTGSSITTIPIQVDASHVHDPQGKIRAAQEVQGRLLNVLPQLASAFGTTQGRGGVVRGAEKGSNNWVVQPSLTNNNKGLLANDPHLSMDAPSVWYLVSLDSKTNGTGTVHLAGASFAGYPGILLGQNEDLAWGGTVAYFDLADVYVETLNAAGDAVLFNGNEVPIVTRTFEIQIQNGAPRTVTARYVPHHGPIVSYDPANNTAVSIRWVGHDADTDLNMFFKLWTSTTTADARTALLDATSTGQNWVVVDRAGDIGWFPYSRVPVRPWASGYLPPWLPLPGDGTAEWEGYHSYDELPQLSNPPEGYIATANNDMTGALWDGDPTNDGRPYWQSLVDPGFREERIKVRLDKDVPNLDRALMQDIQSDIQLAVAEAVLPQIMALANDSGGLSAAGLEVRSALNAWDFTCPTGLLGDTVDAAADPDPDVAAASAGCAAFHAIFYRLNDRIFGDELAAYNFSSETAREETLIALLTRPDSLLNGSLYWDDVSTSAVESEFDMIIAVFDDAGSYLNTTLGNGAANWKWGRLHTVLFRALLFPSFGSNQYNDGPYCNDGGLWTIDVANPSGPYADDYQHRGGPSMRFACETDAAGVRCTMELPGGNRNFRDSPFRNNLVPGWLHNQPFPLHFLPADITGAATEVIMVQAP